MRWISLAADVFCRCDRTALHAFAILDAFLDSAPAALFTVGPSSTRYPRTARQARAASGAGMVALVDPSGLLAEQAAARRAVLSHAVAALLLACKFHEVEIHAAAEFAEFASICMESLLDRPPPHGGLAVPYNDDEPQLVISVEELVRAESRVCEVLELDMAMPVASEFLFVLLQRLRWPAAYSVHRGAHARVAMVAQMYCELAAHLEECIGAPPSLVASAALCAALARLRCGLWSEGAAAARAPPERYWTAAMAQATGYARAELGVISRRLLDLHDVVCREHDAHGHSGGGGGGGGDGGGEEEDDVTALAAVWLDAPLVGLRRKFAHERFLGALLATPPADEGGRGGV